MYGHPKCQGRIRENDFLPLEVPSADSRTVRAEKGPCAYQVIRVLRVAVQLHDVPHQKSAAVAYPGRLCRCPCCGNASQLHKFSSPILGPGSTISCKGASGPYSTGGKELIQSIVMMQEKDVAGIVTYREESVLSYSNRSGPLENMFTHTPASSGASITSTPTHRSTSGCCANHTVVFACPQPVSSVVFGLFSGAKLWK